MFDDSFGDIMQAIRDHRQDGRLDAIEGYFPYETIKYAATLRFLDGRHSSAVFERHQKIRFIDDGVGVFFDRVWGDGILFGDYYARGLRVLEPIRALKGYIVPLLLPRVFRRGETFSIVTKRKTIAAFYDARGQWDTAMHAPTDLVTINVQADANELSDSEIIAPPRGDIHAEQHAHQLRFRVARPALYTPYRLTWSWK